MYALRTQARSRISTGRCLRISSIGRDLTSVAYPHIYIHKQGTKEAAISYLPNPPREESRAVVGYVPLLSSGKDIDLSSPSKVRLNPAFQTALNEVCKQYAHEDPILQAMAATQDSGHLHIADEKNPPPYGRIPYPEDIIGTCRIEHGRLIKDTFTPMREAYRPVSSNGVVKLSEFLEKRMISLLKSEEAT